MSDFSDRAAASQRVLLGWRHRLRRLLHMSYAPHMPDMQHPPHAPHPADATDTSLPAFEATASADQWPVGSCVLVADDNPVNLEMAYDLLAYFGIQSLLAADGAQAVAMAAHYRLDLILMDLQMPVLDGLGATQQIRRAERQQARARVPVLAYTSVNGIRLHLADFGLDGVLQKPCELPAMRACLHRWCPPSGGAGAQASAAGLPSRHARSLPPPAV